MRHFSYIWLSCIGLLVIESSSWAQLCIVGPEQRFVPPGVEELGTSVSLWGDHAMAGAPAAGEGGRVWAFVRNAAGTWNVQQMFSASETTQGDGFGTTLSIHGQVAVIGAPNKSGAALQQGAAYVFEQSPQGWIETAKLVAPDGAPEDRFGHALAVSNDFIAVGANFADSTFQNSGAVYLFQKSEKSWVFQQKLFIASAEAYEGFGWSLALAGDWLIAGAPGRSLSGVADSGAAFAFRFNGSAWTLQQTLGAHNPVPNENFGFSMAAHSDAVVIGATGGSHGNNNHGSVSVFRLNGNGWEHEAKLTAELPLTSHGIGDSVAMYEDIVLAGSPDRNVALTFVRGGGQWSLRATAVGDVLDQASQDYFGAAVSLWDDTFMIGAPNDWRMAFQVYIVGSTMFGPVFPDCNKNGVPDPCDTDCNGNLIADECDLASGASTDCNSNDVPDLCESSATYQVEADVISSAYGTNNPRDIIWLNQFVVESGQEIIDFVDVNWTMWAPIGSATILVYTDPSGSGDPLQAVLSSTAPTLIYRGLQDGIYANWSRVKITPTAIGKAGDSFFVGAMASSLNDEFPATFYAEPSSATGHFFYGVYGQGDINNLGNNFYPILPPVTFAIRAGATDCNGNGIWDGCDISNGTSVDHNANGIPDECEKLACTADVTGDLIVNVNDLLAVIGAWGPCAEPCPPACIGDVTKNCGVSVDDVLFVIEHWGPCP